METVALIRGSGTSIPEVCREFDLTETAVRRWVARAEIDAGERNGLTTAEREELALLRLALRRRGAGAARGAGDPETSRGLLREGDDPVSRFRFIAAEQAHQPVVRLCRVLGVSASGFDAW